MRDAFLFISLNVYMRSRCCSRVIPIIFMESTPAPRVVTSGTLVMFRWLSVCFQALCLEALVDAAGSAGHEGDERRGHDGGHGGGEAVERHEYESSTASGGYDVRACTPYMKDKGLGGLYVGETLKIMQPAVGCPAQRSHSVPFGCSSQSDAEMPPPK